MVIILFIICAWYMVNSFYSSGSSETYPFGGISAGRCLPAGIILPSPTISSGGRKGGGAARLPAGRAAILPACLPACRRTRRASEIVACRRSWWPYTVYLLPCWHRAVRCRGVAVLPSSMPCWYGCTGVAGRACLPAAAGAGCRRLYSLSAPALPRLQQGDLVVTCRWCDTRGTWSYLPIGYLYRRPLVHRATV